MRETSSVVLRVYDLSGGRAAIWSPLVLGRRINGIWHTGILAFGHEYFYGGGVEKMTPEDVESRYNMKAVDCRHLGQTIKTRAQFEQHLVSIQDHFTPKTYDLVKWNCNHFTNSCAEYLLGVGLPSYIMSQPAHVSQSFMGQAVLRFVKLFRGDNPLMKTDHPAHPCNLHRRDEESRGSAQKLTPRRSGRRRRPENYTIADIPSKNHLDIPQFDGRRRRSSNIRRSSDVSPSSIVGSSPPSSASGRDDRPAVTTGMPVTPPLEKPELSTLSYIKMRPPPYVAPPPFLPVPLQGTVVTFCQTCRLEHAASVLRCGRCGGTLVRAVRSRREVVKPEVGTGARYSVTWRPPQPPKARPVHRWDNNTLGRFVQS